MKDDYDAAPMVLTKFTESFKEVDYTIPLNGPFDVTPTLTAIELEARSKQCAVVVQVALIPLDDFWGELVEDSEGDANDDQ